MRLATCTLCACLLVSCLTPAVAGAADDWAKFASGELYNAYVIAGLALPLMDKNDPETQALRSADTYVTNGIATLGLKKLFRVARPEPFSDEHNSFPSGHASSTFAIAALQSEFHPEQAGYWYGGAALISASRVSLNRHRIQDVIAGAALGYGIAQLELNSERGLLISPFVDPVGDGFGVQLNFDL